MGKTKLLTFDEFFMKKGAIYKDASVFSPSYIPEVFKFREKEWNLIGNIFSSFFDRTNIHVYISGPPGTGKTHMVCKLIEGFNEHAKKDNIPFNFVMVNCQKLTYPGVVGALAQKYSPELKIGKKKPGEIFPYIIEGMAGTNTCFIFDEVDKILPSAPYTNPYDCLFGDFSRFNERWGVKQAIGCVIIGNKPNLDMNIDPSTHSSFIPTRICFKDYAAGEICDILWERCFVGFQPNVVDLQTVAKFAKEVSEYSHDLRTVFKVFSGVGSYVKNHGRDTITNEDLAAVLKITEIEGTVEIIRSLNDIQKILLYVIAQIQKKKPRDRFAVTTDALWCGYQSFEEEVTSNGGKKLEERTQRHILETVMKKLESQGLFSTGIKGSGRGKGQIKYFHIEPKDFDKIYTAISEIIKTDWGIEDAHSHFMKNNKII